jgi:hypothetical protein
MKRDLNQIVENDFLSEEWFESDAKEIKEIELSSN